MSLSWQIHAPRWVVSLKITVVHGQLELDVTSLTQWMEAIEDTIHDTLVEFMVDDVTVQLASLEDTVRVHLTDVLVKHLSIFNLPHICPHPLL